jgi:uncharacterized SAM-binding protein YcdF (DUF218 family)
VEGAWHLGEGIQNANFLVTGGQGTYGPPEAQVMKELLLRLGAPEQQIMIEDQSFTTMDSVFHCAAMIKQNPEPHPRVTVCSSPYHNFRCQLLFGLLGVEAQRGAMSSDRPALGTIKWLYYYLREGAAIPWDYLHLRFLLFAGRIVS